MQSRVKIKHMCPAQVGLCCLMDFAFWRVLIAHLNRGSHSLNIFYEEMFPLWYIQCPISIWMEQKWRRRTLEPSPIWYWMTDICMSRESLPTDALEVLLFQNHKRRIRGRVELKCLLYTNPRQLELLLLLMFTGTVLLKWLKESRLLLWGLVRN